MGPAHPCRKNHWRRDRGKEKAINWRKAIKTNNGKDTENSDDKKEQEQENISGKVSISKKIFFTSGKSTISKGKEDNSDDNIRIIGVQNAERKLQSSSNMIDESLSKYEEKNRDEQIQCYEEVRDGQWGDPTKELNYVSRETRNKICTNLGIMFIDHRTCSEFGVNRNISDVPSMINVSVFEKYLNEELNSINVLQDNRDIHIDRVNHKLIKARQYYTTTRFPDVSKEMLEERIAEIDKIELDEAKIEGLSIRKLQAKGMRSFSSTQERENALQVTAINTPYQKTTNGKEENFKVDNNLENKPECTQSQGIQKYYQNHGIYHRRPEFIIGQIHRHVQDASSWRRGDDERYKIRFYASNI